MPLRLLLLSLVLLLPLPVLTTAPAYAQTPLDGADVLFADAFALYQSRLYGASARAFEAFRTRYPAHPAASDALYYQAEATLAAGLDDAAVRLFTAFQQRHPEHPHAAEAQLTLGKFFYQQGRYDRALAVLQAVLDQATGRDLAARTLYWMGETAHRSGNTDRALDYFRRAAELTETETAPLALYTLGYLHIENGRSDDAAQAFETLKVRYPDAPLAQDVGLALAEAYYAIGDYRRAVDELQRRLPNVDGETRERVTFLIAESYNQLERYDDAVVFYRRFLEQEANPGSPYLRPAQFGLAWNYHHNGSHQQAARTFAEVADGAQDDLAHQAAYQAAVNLQLGGLDQQAEAAYATVYDRWPNGTLSDHALYEHGMLRFKARNWRDAADLFARFRRRYAASPLAPEATRMLAESQVAQGQFDQALATYEAGLYDAPPELRAELAFQKAWLLYLEKRYTEAIPALRALRENAPNGPHAADALFWQAESHYQLAQFDQAERLFEQFIRQHADHEQYEAAFYALGWTHFKRADYSNAARSFERFLAEYRGRDATVPYRADATLRLADSYYAMKRYTDAIRLYGRVVETGEDYAQYQIAQAYAASGQRGQAIRAFRRLASDNAYSEFREEALYNAGYLYFLDNDFDAAVAAYEDLIGQFPRHPLAAKAQYGIGDALFNQGNYDAAERAYRSVLARYPGSPFVADALLGVQYALLAKGEDDGVDAVVDSFAVRYPDSPVLDEIRFRQAELRFQSGELNQAVAAFQQFIRTARDPQFLAQSYLYLGLSFAQLRQYDEAIAYLRELIRTYPDRPERVDATRQLGQVYLEQERYRDALTLYRDFENRTPSAAAEARYGQGLALIGLGDLSQAERVLSSVVDGAPDAPESTPALLGLARVYEATNQGRRALQTYRSVVRRSTDAIGAEALWRLGDLLLRQRQPEAALEELGRMPVLYAGYPSFLAQSYLVSARAYLTLGQTAEARRLYEQVVAEFPDSPYAADARAELDDL